MDPEGTKSSTPPATGSPPPPRTAPPADAPRASSAGSGALTALRVSSPPSDDTEFHDCQSSSQEAAPQQPQTPAEASDSSATTATASIGIALIVVCLHQLL